MAHNRIANKLYACDAAPRCDMENKSKNPIRKRQRGVSFVRLHFRRIILLDLVADIVYWWDHRNQMRCDLPLESGGRPDRLLLLLLVPIVSPSKSLSAGDSNFSASSGLAAENRLLSATVFNRAVVVAKASSSFCSWSCCWCCWLCSAVLLLIALFELLLRLLLLLFWWSWFDDASWWCCGCCGLLWIWLPDDEPGLIELRRLRLSVDWSSWLANCWFCSWLRPE